jgi:hypothetical protein
LRRERDEEIRAAREADVPVTDIAEAFGLSHQQVSNIARCD